MRRRRPEIPQMWIVVAHQQRIAGDLVARPFADDRGGEIADVVVVEAQHRAEIGRGQRFLRAGQPVFMQPVEIDTLFKIDPRMPRRRDGTIPVVVGVQIVIAGKDGGIGQILRHGGLLGRRSFVVGWTPSTPSPLRASWKNLHVAGRSCKRLHDLITPFPLNIQQRRPVDANPALYHVGSRRRAYLRKWGASTMSRRDR